MVNLFTDILPVEYGNSYLPDDLDMFFGNFSPRQVGERPTLVSIDGGEAFGSDCLNPPHDVKVPSWLRMSHL